MTEKRTKFAYGEDTLTTGIALQLARKEIIGYISETSRIRINQSCNIVSNIVENSRPVYGINTGFGPLCTTHISKEETKVLQVNLLKSHSVGVGDPISIELTKIMLVLKLHALSKGYSGISITTLERILWHLENEIIPVVPCQGSVGASGDLAPLAHLFLPLIGLGMVNDGTRVISTENLFKEKGLKSLELGPKEGLALINGTQFIAAHAVKVIEKFHSCLAQADIIAAMMIEGLQGSMKPFHPELHKLRPYKGSKHVAFRVKALLENSEIMKDHLNCEKVQDPYSLRCIPQVHGASRNAWLHLKELLEVELNSVTDNPVVIDEDLTISGGNFHGQPLAMALDYVCLAASEIGNISDRRIYLALKGNSPGVPKLLMEDTGIHSGYMILQYTSAALASENKVLCHPASADSIPTSLGQEDHVSMGSISGRKALQVLSNIEKILAIELLTAAQAFEFRQPLKSGPVLNEIHHAVREQIPFADQDRVFANDINKGIQMINDKTILKIARETRKSANISLKSEYVDVFERY